MGLSPAAASLLWHGLAASTRNRAGGSVTTFCTFCAFSFGPNIPCLPASSSSSGSAASSSLSPLTYAGHSFRRGAATWAASLGADADTIQCLGQWNSDCFQCYIDHSAAEHQDLSITALYCLWDGALIPHTTSWHDVGSS
ncbi:uncharacterized protein UBRO2_00317 [Ustilago bromivora]|uniref:Uncharacterized protein n=1 Tax=Ustilago bromivora TaxID=307758 RepID=A0A8H8TNV3_9BASI|nr:uncharacterized protein UBRO2_00317 [Ustilago bromivora]